MFLVGIALIAGVAITAQYQRIDRENALGIAISGFVLILCYVLTRFNVVQIASAGASISQ